MICHNLTIALPRIIVKKAYICRRFYPKKNPKKILTAMSCFVIKTNFNLFLALNIIISGLNSQEEV